MKGILQRILQEIMKKNDTWNIRRLVDETIVPSTQRITYIEDCQISQHPVPGGLFRPSDMRK